MQCRLSSIIGPLPGQGQCTGALPIQQHTGITCKWSRSVHIHARQVVEVTVILHQTRMSTCKLLYYKL